MIKKTCEWVGRSVRSAAARVKSVASETVKFNAAFVKSEVGQGATAAALALSMVVFGASKGWCVGTDLLAGADFATLADNVIATATPIVTALLPVLGFGVALIFGKRIVKMFAR